MTYVGGKHWDFYVHDTALWAPVGTVLAEFYIDGPLPTDLPGLHPSGAHANAWRYKPSKRDSGDHPGHTSALAALRTRVLSGRIADILNHLDVFTHDPDTGEDPIVDRAVLAEAIESHLRGDRDPKPLRADWPVHDPHLGPIMASADGDDFSGPVDLRKVAVHLTAVIAGAIESGAIEVDASEPYDSCSGCGGYHNVNYDCEDD